MGLRKYDREQLPDQTIQALWDVQDFTLGYLPNLSKNLVAAPEIYKVIFSLARLIFLSGNLAKETKHVLRASIASTSNSIPQIARVASYCKQAGMPADKLMAILNCDNSCPFSAMENAVIDFGRCFDQAPLELRKMTLNKVSEYLNQEELIELVCVASAHQCIVTLNRLAGTEIEKELEDFIPLSQVSNQALFDAIFYELKTANTKTCNSIDLVSYEQLNNQSVKGIWQFFEKKIGFVPYFIRMHIKWQNLVAQLGQLAQVIIESNELPNPTKFMVSFIVALEYDAKDRQIRLLKLFQKNHVPDSRVLAVRNFEDSNLFSPAEKIAFSFAKRFCHSQNRPTEEDFEQLKKYFTAAQIVALLASISYYLHVQGTEVLMGLGIEPELNDFVNSNQLVMQLGLTPAQATTAVKA